MLDEMVIMERILNMSPEERRRVMQKALDDSHITCMDGPGAVVFNGFASETAVVEPIPEEDDCPCDHCMCSSCRGYERCSYGQKEMN